MPYFEASLKNTASKSNSRIQNPILGNGVHEVKNATKSREMHDMRVLT